MPEIIKSYIPAKLQFQPGIDKDSTIFDTNYYVDSQWVRFFEGRPSKIGGYTEIFSYNEIIRDMLAVDNNDIVDIYAGRSGTPTSNGGIGYLPIKRDGTVLSPVDVTPDSYAGNAASTWPMALVSTPYSSLGFPAGQYVLTVTTQNGLNVTNTYEGELYAQQVGTTGPFLLVIDQGPGAIGIISASGGVVYSAPILVVYGNNGLVQYCDPTKGFTEWSNALGEPFQATITNTKIIYGAATNGGDGIGFLFWAPPNFVRATFILTTTFDESTFDAQRYPMDISVMSPNCIVQYQNTFYWIGNDEFYQFNGIVTSLVNNLSSNYFFDNVNPKYLSRVTGMVQPRFREVWWFWPDRDSADGEANNCLIMSIMMSINQKTFYNVKIKRSIGISPANLEFPVIADNQLEQIFTPTGPELKYALWAHETGRDKVINGVPTPIKSYITTKPIDLFSSDPSMNRYIDSKRFVPDFIMAGDMTLSLQTRAFPASNPQTHGPYPFGPSTEYIDLGIEQGLLVSFTYESNTLGGYFKAGAPYLLYYVGDHVK